MWFLPPGIPVQAQTFPLEYDQDLWLLTRKSLAKVIGHAWLWVSDYLRGSYTAHLARTLRFCPLLALKRGDALFFHPGLHRPVWHWSQGWWAWEERRRATGAEAVRLGLRSRRRTHSGCLRSCGAAELAAARTLSLKLLYIQGAINKCL